MAAYTVGSLLLCACRAVRAVLWYREGFNRDGSSVESRGIIPRAIEQIFLHIQKYASPRVRFLVRGSYLQIYNETVSGGVTCASFGDGLCAVTVRLCVSRCSDRVDI